VGTEAGVSMDGPAAPSAAAAAASSLSARRAALTACCLSFLDGGFGRMRSLTFCRCRRLDEEIGHPGQYIVGGTMILRESVVPRWM
jgi:hypothetical protein